LAMRFEGAGAGAAEATLANRKNRIRKGFVIIAA